MTHRKRSWERRGAPRAEVPATAYLIVQKRRVGSYVLENLSAGGALVTGGPVVKPGSDVQVVLHLSDRRLPIMLPARVVRSPASGAIAIAFEHLSPNTEDTIQELVLSHLERMRRTRRVREPAVLVVDDCLEVRDALARQLAALGCDVATAGTPLDAIRQLDLNEVTIRTAVVDLFLGNANGLDLLAYLADEHPGVRRVLMSGQARPCQLRLALLREQAHAVLHKPWSRDGLAQTVVD